MANTGPNISSRVDLHIWRHPVKERPTHEIPFVALQPELASIDQQLRTFPDAGLDIANCSIKMLSRYQRLHLGLGIVTRSDPKTAYASGQPFGETICRRFADRNCDGNGDSTLPGRSISRAHQGVDGLVEMGIGRDDHMVLGTSQSLASLP
jgi:hypothetical protein